MLRSAISAFTRVFDALCLAAWCAADPGATMCCFWVPALCGAARERCTASGTRFSAASTPPRPCRGEREHQPADDQKRAAGWCCHRKQAVAGILPQRQVAGEQGDRDDKAESGGDAYSDMDDAAIGQRHRGEHG